MAELDYSKGYRIYYNENNAISLIEYKWNDEVIDINRDIVQCSLQYHFVSKQKYNITFKNIKFIKKFGKF